MRTSIRLRVDPGALEAAPERSLEIAVPYTQPDVTRKIVERAAVLAHGLEARLCLVAVHAAPYPGPLNCPNAVRAFLVERLLELCANAPLPAEARIVVARSFDEGFRRTLRPESIVLLGTRRRFWRTREERLARALAADGHRVNLFNLG
ncbi:MAG TPA: hypothetical protein VMA31_05600 [Bryobacteraceae bacterium]|nr:hypothetical protein [Bryobacteraceae bacterium]